MEGPFGFVVMVVVGALVVYGVVKQNRATNEAWNGAAARLSLAFTPGGLTSRRTIFGDIRGSMVLVETYSEGSGKNSKTCTRYTVTFPASLDHGLQLTRQGFLSKVAGWLGSQDIEIGSADFDDDIVVKGRMLVVPESAPPIRRSLGLE